MMNDERKKSVVAILVLFVAAFARADVTVSEKLNDICKAAVQGTQKEFEKDKLKDEDIGVTVIDMRDGEHLTKGKFRGEAQFYPASTVKLFYLVAAQQWLEEGKLTETEELKRGMS